MVPFLPPYNADEQRRIYPCDIHIQCTLMLKVEKGVEGGGGLFQRVTWSKDVDSVEAKFRGKTLKKSQVPQTQLAEKVGISVLQEYGSCLLICTQGGYSTHQI